MPSSAVEQGPKRLLSRLDARLDAWLQRHELLAGAGLYAVALALRLLHLLTFRHTLTARVFMMDPAYYHEEAWNLVRGIPNASDSYFMTPLYPFFLSLLYRVAGDATTLVYALQLSLGALTAPFVFALSQRAMPRPWAALTGLAVASFAPIVFFEALLLVEWLVLLALLAASVAAVRRPARRLHAWLAGACLGIAVLGRGSNVLLVPVFLVWFALRGGSRRLSQAGSALLGCLVVLAPLFAYNLRHAEQPLLLTANAGFNLYIGNGPEATGLFVLPPDFDFAQDPLALRYVQRETGERATASVASRFWLRKTWDWVRPRPGRALELLAWKWVLFWNRFSFPQVESFETATRGLPLSRFPFWHGYVMLPLGFLGIVLGLGARVRAGRGRGEALERAECVVFVAACTLVYAASIALFFVTDRYRMPAVPWLVLLTGYALWRFVAAWRAGARKQVLGLALAGVLFFVLTAPQRIGVDRDRVRRDILVHSALRYAQAGLFDAAVDEYAQAWRAAPRDADLRDGMARMLDRSGRDSLARQAFRDLLRNEPQFARGWYNYGNFLRRSGRHAEAVVAYQRSVELEPRREGAWNNLGESYRALGDTLAAAQAYEQALALVPGYEQALNNLGALRGAQGQAAAAEAGFRAAVAANPRYLPAWTNLGVLLTNQGRFDEAVATWERLRVLDSGDSLAAQVLRRIEAARGGGTK